MNYKARLIKSAICKLPKVEVLWKYAGVLLGDIKLGVLHIELPTRMNVERHLLMDMLSGRSCLLRRFYDRF